MIKLVHCTVNSKWIVLIYAFIFLVKILSENIVDWTLKIYMFNTLEKKICFSATNMAM